MHRAADAGLVAPASLACSLVSSPGLETVADHYGLDFHATLTGFKWISRAPGLVFGFEEALGYLVNPETVRDKDGVSAAVAVLGTNATPERYAEIRSELDLDELVVLTAQVGDDALHDRVAGRPAR